MTSYRRRNRFATEFKNLSEEDRKAFREAVARFVAALRSGSSPDPSLGISQLVNHPGIYEFPLLETRAGDVPLRNRGTRQGC